MVEDYQQAVSVANLGGVRDVQGLYSQLGLKNPPQVFNLFLFQAVFSLLDQLLQFGFLYFA